MPQRLTGTVTRLFTDKGFGFLLGPDQETEYFFHCSSTLGFLSLKEGSIVTFEPGTAPRGPRAENVQPGPGMGLDSMISNQ